MNFAEANRRYFDAISDSYDSKPWFATVNNQVTEALRGDLSWVGIPFAHDANAPSQVRLLDYACGTGLMTRVFGPYVTQTMGLDISPNMVSTYNKRAQSAGLSPETVHAVCGNLFDKSDPYPTAFSGPEWQGFDLATVGFGFHHFEDVVHSARQLKERLRPGGVLVINDFLEGGDWLADEEGRLIEGSRGNHAVHRHDHGDHSHGHGHGHKHDHHQDTHHHGHEHHGHDHDHDHGHQDESNEETKLSLDDTTPEFRKKMTASIVVPHFTLDGVKEFFMQAGFVDVDVITMKEKSFMEFGGKKLWRTILFARGRRPMVEEENDGLRSEL